MRRTYVVMLLLLLLLGILRGRVREGMTPRINTPDMTPLRVKNFDENRIYEFDNFLTKEECEALIAHGSSRVRPSMVVCSNGVNCPNPSRTSKNTFIKDSENKVAELVTAKVEDAIGISRRHFEDLQIVHYECIRQNLLKYQHAYIFF